MTAGRLMEYVLKFLLVALPIIYLPWAEDPFRHFRENIFQLGAVAAVLLFIYGRLFGGEPGEKKTPVPFEDELALLCVAVGGFLLSLFINGPTPTGITTAANFILGVALYAFFRLAVAPADAGRWIGVFMVPALANALLAILQYTGRDPFFQSLDPIYHNIYRRYLVAGFLDSPNLLAPFVASFLPYFFARFLMEENPARAGTWGVALATAALPVGLSQNLSGAIPAALVLGLMLAYFTWRFFRKGGTALAKLAVSWTLAAIIATAAVAERAAADEDTQILKQWSLNERITQDRACLMMFSQGPLFGKGPGFFYSHFTEYRRAVWLEQAPMRLPDRPATQAHNDYLQLLAEGGMVAFFPVVAVAGILLFSHGRFFYRRIGREPLPLEPHLMGAAGGFWIIALNALGSFPFHVAPLALAAIFWGAVAAMIKYPADEN